jgi:UDP-N-acetylglucosamine--N-acetylmuramyl-(pentapeptide) pyrophosphoryl-undecaprenol N-acetylglucosamine transferase
MKIVVTGGGSGGHITPILAVAHELKALDPQAEIIYIGQKGDALADIPAADPNIDAVYTVWAGKLRRYADEGWTQLFHIRTQALNIRDTFRVLRGTWQRYRLMRQLKPDVIFTRGGFVSVPVAIGGRLNRIPYITHDSDSVPSLANRLIARWAAVHAVALPVELYPYPTDKTVMVGVPVSAQYQPVTDELRIQYREQLGLENFDQVVLLTGGGNGARVLNEALAANAKYLLSTFPGLAIVHIAGRALETEANTAYDALTLGAARGRVFVRGFITDLYRYSGTADVIVARGGATNLAEFALQAKPCIIVPAPQLVGNHQVKNTQAMAERGAVLMMDEDQIEQPERLGRTIGELLQDDKKRIELAHALADYAHPHAAAELAALVLKTGGGEVDVRTEK